MEQTFCANEITVGFHFEGYRIDKTASPMNQYTKWKITAGNRWRNPRPVSFDSLSEKGWIKKDKFDWHTSIAMLEHLA